jgi:hypothetical protein
VKQHAFAQPEDPGSEFLIGLPALGNARHNVPLLIDIGQTGLQGRNGVGSVILIVAV